MYNGYPVAYEAHNTQIVRYEQVGEAVLLLQLAHQIEHLCADGYVQRAYGFICNYELRLHYQRAGYADTLTLTAGKLMREAAGKFGKQTNVQQRLLNHFAALFLAQVLAYVLQAFAYNVVYLGPFVKACHGVLEYHLNILGDLLIQFLGYFAAYAFAVEQYFAGGHWVDADYGTADGGFTGTGFADQTERFALVYVKTDIVHGYERMAFGTEGDLHIANAYQYICQILSHCSGRLLCSGSLCS